jgi:RNA-binding protein YhbY
MLILIGSRINCSNTFAKWLEDSQLSYMRACISHPLFVVRGGTSLKIPDSILRQAKDASLPVTMRIGKSGLTDAVVVELDGQLSSRTLVKAKVNRGLFPREEMKRVWAHLAHETSSQIVFARGNVAVFWKN